MLRKLSLHTDFQNWEEQVASLNLQYKITKDYDFSNVVKLLDNNTLVATGYGKGSPLDNKVSAAYESLQQYVENTSYIQPAYILLSLQEAKKQLDIYTPKISKDYLLEKKFQHLITPWIEFFEINTSCSIWLHISSLSPYYPYAPYSDDELNYNQLYVESSDNGIASGYDFEEALLHSILELIQRDALSNFLIQCIIKHESSVYLLNVSIKDFIFPNDNNFNLHHKIEVYLLSSQFNLQTVGVIIRNKTKIPYRGFHTSPNIYSAIQGAIDEAIQDFYIREQIKANEEIYSIYDIFRNNDILAKCMEMNVSGCKCKKLDLESVPNFNAYEENVSLFLRNLIHQLYNSNYKIFYRKIYEIKWTCSVQAVIPGFNEFFTIIYGNITSIYDEDIT